MTTYTALLDFADVKPVRIFGPDYDWTSAHEPATTVPAASRHIQYFTTHQTAFPVDGGRLLLRTRAPLRLTLGEQPGWFEVDDWGIRLLCVKAHELPHHVVRKFLSLLARADDQSLSESEQRQWLSILDQVDYQQFSIDRAQPHYVEGRMISCAKGQSALVEWADDTTSTVPAKISQALAILEPGERFSAYVKWGKDNEILALETVALLV